MSRTPPEIAARIVAQLGLTAPGLDCRPGTIQRKIIDACAEAISEGHVEQYLVASLLDLDSKVGLELEQFVGNFGYGRLQGKAAEGVVRITLNTAAPQDYSIPLGTQFYTKNGVTGAGLAGGQTLYFASTQAVVLTAGSLSVDVPVQCSIVGAVGNVPPDTIIYLGNTIGAGSATNLTALTGGVNVESDTELRQRFKDTFLRNIAGTADWYRAICLQNNRVSRVAVYGPTTLYRTQIAAPAATAALSLNQDVKYVWPDMHSCFTNLGQEDQVFYSPTYDYTLTSGASPVFTRVSTGEIETGDIVDLEFQYVTRCSRNDPVNDITNKVDVFVDGVESHSVTEKTVVSAAALSATSTNPLYTGNFVRIGSTGSPSAGNRFMRLGSVPVVTFPATITVDGVVFTQGVHYHLVRDTTLRAGSPQEVSGIEWEDEGPANGTELTLSYVYNQVPEVISHVMSATKQVGSDVMVHQAKFVYLRPCLSIEYERAYSVQSVNSAIDIQLKGFFSNQPYGAQMKLSSIALVVQQVLGVANVKVTTSAEAPDDYGVEVYNSAEDPAPAQVYTDDFKLDDNALPIFVEATILRKATP
ncbi:baseplate J protein [Mycobacterium phage Phrappuccino]|uniref:Baseplate J protein n=1 Tax=Mycobacterium phage Phrappuccino TaxID=2591223 RepID=A0A514DDT0_9CAUD|nr:baseplate wedge subunit [Mycobacterium phage Phrappuccino]QDH91760.1 baseplate J protein [Mycobacterium phage Phrappuccino]QIQ63202.1 baseplate J protein [Mycobacterium phage Settecandela]